MARSDIHLDAMLRHLGAAYYDCLHGKATRTEVDRALEAVRQGMGGQETPRPARAGTPAGARHADREGHWPAGRWTRRVRDVMSTPVVAVDRLTPYKEIARLLAEHQISGVPVLGTDQHVIGVVTEADLLAAGGKNARRAPADAGSDGRLRWPRRARPRPGLTAGTLMTTPAVTIHPDATIPAAARLMTSRHIRRLPVVDTDGTLLGIVSRRDLLAAFLRPDGQIAAEVRGLLQEILRENAADVVSMVRDGVVVLTGTPGPAEEADLIPVAIRLIWDIDGVVDVVNKLTTPQPATGA